MNRETLDRWCERGILASVLGILVFGPLAMGAVDAPEFLVVQGLTMAVMLLWALRLWISPKPQLLWPPLGWVVLAFAALAIGRYLTADIEYVARQEMIQVLMYAFLFFAIVNNLYRQELAQIISFTLIFLAMGISCFAGLPVFYALEPGLGFGFALCGPRLGHLHFAEQSGGLSGNAAAAGDGLRAGGTHEAGHADFAGLRGTGHCGGDGGDVFARRLGGGRHGGADPIGNLDFSSQPPAAGAPAVGHFGGGGTVFVTKYLSKTVSYMRRVGTADGTAESSVELDFPVRRDLWIAAEQMWRDHFWWGVGPAHYDYRFREYRPESIQLSPDRAHNDYLNLLADWGVVGGIIVLAGMVVFGAGLRKTWKYVRPAENDFGRGMSNRFAFFLGASTGLLALAVHSVVDFNLHIPANAILGVTLAGIVEQQSAVCHGALLAERAAAGQNTRDLGPRGRSRLFGLSRLATRSRSGLAGAGRTGARLFPRAGRGSGKGVCRRADEF